MIRLATTLAAFALLASAPAASAQDFREPEVRAALAARSSALWPTRSRRAARPAAIVDRTLLSREPEELGTSRLGGRPDLPAGTKWPRCRGYAQTFLGQSGRATSRPSSRNWVRMTARSCSSPTSSARTGAGTSRSTANARRSFTRVPARRSVAPRSRGTHCGCVRPPRASTCGPTSRIATGATA